MMDGYRTRLLSYILEQFMLTAKENDDEEHQFNFSNKELDKFSNLGFCQYIQTGSSAENLYVPFPNHSKSDIDLMFEFPYIVAVDQEQLKSSEEKAFIDESRKRFLFIDYSNKKYPCYLKLYFNCTQKYTVWNENVPSSFKLPGTDVYVTTENCVDPHQQYFTSLKLVTWCKNQWSTDANFDEKLEIHGPSICQTSNNPNTPLPMDHVPAFKCVHWPKPAAEWITRARDHNWPDRDLVETMAKFGCHIVPVSHTLTEDHEKPIEFRFSFSVCELMIAKTLGYFQRKSYLIIKALVDVHIKQEPELSKVMPSYYLKTSLYWLCESIPKECWTCDTLYDRFIDFIDYLINCFESRLLKHYFIPEMNLLDHLTYEVCTKISERCRFIKHNLLDALRLAEEHYWNSNQFIRFNTVIEVLEKRSDPEDYSCIIWCCAKTMEAFIVQHQIIDLPLKMINNCIKRDYLKLCTNESARFLLYVTNMVYDHLFDTNRTYSKESLSALNAMIKICELKKFDDQLYDTILENYNEIKNYLSEKQDTK